MAERTVYIIDIGGNASQKMKGLQTEAKKTDGVFAGIGNTLGVLGAGVGIGAIVGLTKGIYDLTAGAEQTRIQFEVMLGSIDKADSLIKDIRQFAAATPFETQDLEKAATTMLGFGIAAEDIMPNIKMLGDVAGGNADKFDRIVYAFSQVSATGRLMGQDLLQLINAGFNPLQTISQKTGISIGQLKKQMEDGLISSQMVAEAFKIETTEGGRFFGMMEKQSQTLSGKMGTLLDNVKMLGLGIGQDLAGGLHTFIDAGLKTLDVISNTAWSDFGNIIWELSGGIRIGVESLNTLGQAFGFLGESGLSFQHVLDGITVGLRVLMLPVRVAIDSLLLLVETLKSIAVAKYKIETGDLEGAMNSFGGVGEKAKKIKEDFTGIFDFDGRNFGVGKQKGLMSGIANALKPDEKTTTNPNAFDALGDGTVTKKGKTKRQGAGGVTLNESRNGATNINFNIDTFQKNIFEKGGMGVNTQAIKDFLDQMAQGLVTVLNDSQIAARQ
jgi:tape measure domain-containing protein